MRKNYGAKGIRRGGFTLVELLVVIAIIAILMAILIPSLARAREQSLTLKCSANMRAVGQAVHGFAAEHDGRGPGSAHVQQTSTTDPSGFNPSGSGASIAWTQILREEYFSGNDLIHRMGWNDGRKKLTCTAQVQWIHNANGWNGTYRPWVINDKVLSGPALHRAHFPGVYDASGHYSAAGRKLDKYSLGAKLTQFQGDSWKFMLTEAEDSNDSWSGSASNPGSVKLRTGVPPVPYWVGLPRGGSSLAGRLAFRHNGFSSANFLFIDGHVEKLKPTDNVNSKGRYDFTGN